MLDLLVSCVSAVIMYRALCILNKMTRNTAHLPRFAMISVAISSFYSLVAPIYGEEDLAHAMFIIVGASWLIADRRRTEKHEGDCRRREVPTC